MSAPAHIVAEVEHMAETRCPTCGRRWPGQSPRKRRMMSPEFLRGIQRRHEGYRDCGLPPTKTLAEEENVTPGAVKHWLRKARDLDARKPMF